MTAIGHEYMRTDPLDLDVESFDLVEKQRGFQLINPTEKWFPGLQEIREQFASWDWCIGKTPKFSVLKDVQLKSTGGPAEANAADGGKASLKLKVDVVAVSRRFGRLVGDVILICCSPFCVMLPPPPSRVLSTT